jgi:hypothetical protein
MAWGHAAAQSVSRTGVGGNGQVNMAFVPSLWSKRILKSIDDQLLTAKLSNRDYEGELKSHGDSVRVFRVGNIKVQPYIMSCSRSATGATAKVRDCTNTMAWQTVSGASTVVTVDQADYFAFEVEDIERAQADPDYISQFTTRAGFALANAAERYNLAKMITAAKLSTADDFGQIGGTVCQATCSSFCMMPCFTTTNAMSVYNRLVDLGVTMDDYLCPSEGRYIILPSFYTAYLLKDDRFVGAAAEGSGSMRDNAKIGRVAGFDIYTLARATFKSYHVGQTNTMVQNDTATDGSCTDQLPDIWRCANAGYGGCYAYYTGIAGVKEAYTFVDAITKTENIRLQNAFADGVRGLHVYGGKALFPQWLYAIRAYESRTKQTSIAGEI